MTDADRIEGQVLLAIDEAFHALAGKGAGDCEWTRVVKQMLCDVGQKPEVGAYVCTKGVGGAEHGEWLYDVSWIEYGWQGDDRNLEEFKRVLLAAEVEWPKNWGDIRDDFQKLLQVRAELRVFVFSEGRGGAVAVDRDVVRGRLVRMIGSCGHSFPGDRWLICGYSEQNDTVDMTIDGLVGQGSGSLPIQHELPPLRIASN